MGRISHVRISLRTRGPAQALAMARGLALAGQSAVNTATLAAMTYEEMRLHVQNHFAAYLARHKEATRQDGPMTEAEIDLAGTSLGLAESGAKDWLESVGDPDGENLLLGFLEMRGIRDDLSGQDRTKFLNEIRKGYESYLKATLAHNASLERYDLDEARQRAVVENPASPPLPESSEAYATTVATYLDEGKRGGLWAAKTLTEKRDALDFLGEVSGNKPVSQLTKADARKAKAMLLKLPKHRSKSPTIRHLPLNDMLNDTSVPKISARTVNAYLSAFQSFTQWAVNNGHAAENIFVGSRVATKQRGSEGKRDAFSAPQLALMFKHLTDNPQGLVRKEDHKWPVLIAMFTGARLNEVAQLRVEDVRSDGDIWYFDINETDGKSLKNNASARRVPVHAKLLELDLLTFVEQRRQQRHERLFPSFTYTAQNGYGRNVGRWFNEKFLPALALKTDSLVFHSFRHSMITILSQADVPDSMVKAIVGHEQVGVTYTSYFKSGFALDQLHREINKFIF